MYVVGFLFLKKETDSKMFQMVWGVVGYSISF